MNNTIWTDEELFDSAKAYLEMLRKEEAGEKYVKKDYYRKLSHKHGRTEKSFEYRMQNISYVRFLLGRIWLDGLKPAKNVGTKNTARIESILLKLEGGTATPQAVFEFSVRESLQKKEIALPIGNSHPARIPTTISQIQRDAQVKAWVLQNANGICECCDTEAPFCSADGLPYLEVL